MLKQILINVIGRERLNKLSGMVKSKGKKIESLDDVFKILDIFKGKTKVINVTYNYFEASHTYEKISFEGVIHYLQKKFKPLFFKPEIKTYCNGTYEVYEGNGEEKHYIDLQYGDLLMLNGEEKHFQSPYQETSLEFSVKAA